MHIVVYLGSGLFFLITILHVYWTFGGTWGVGKTTPNDKNGEPLKPGIVITFLSALMFLIAGLLPLAALGVIAIDFSQEVYLALLVIGLCFLILRGSLGLALSLRSAKPRTDFNRFNIILYTPLIVVLALSYVCSIIIVAMN